MADITVTGSADFTKVTAGIRRLGAETDAMKKKSGNGGMAILEISRGLEDLQYGIRGVQNNIPTMLTALGAGAGLAGVASLAVVGVSQLVGWLDKLLDKSNEASDAKFAKGVINVSAFRANAVEVQEGIDALVERGAARMRELQVDVSQGDEIRGLNQSIRDNRLQVENARLALDYLKQGKTEEEARADIIKNELRTIKDREDSQRASVEAQRMATEGLSEQIEKQKEVIANFVRMRDSAEAMAKAAVRRGLDKRVSAVGVRTGRMSFIAKDPAQVASERMGNVAVELAKFNEVFDRQALKNAEISAGVASKALEDLRQRQGVSVELLRTAEQENTRKMDELSTARQLLEIEQERAEIMNFKSGAWEFLGIPSPSEIQEMRDLLKVNDEAFSKSLDSFKINGDGLLSSQGRIGGSGDEFRSSVATINYQRETLSELRKIANNTRNRTSTYR